MVDNEDRASQTSRKTARNFVAAANNLELLKVFGDVESGIKENIKYSKRRASEILKAIRDRHQLAPPPEADKPKTEPSSSANDLIHWLWDSQLPQESEVGGGSGFLTIKDFPSPPLTHLSLNSVNSVNTSSNSYTDNASHNPINSSNSVSNTNSTWNPPSSSPSLNQGQGFYSPAGSPGKEH
ncbi:hypothetical protein BGZ65_005767 [Modicella reniformis]|uniref:Vta1/callose synthase N-terminal domain-containing protein n=1 Tax=Modicella reniformis TaxID=1440133 RepID=A0A9P6LS71_9FUNG|nr:hypothetical protein BGZ65_005767 [Modicella reniformis]